jgi:hypothetical protein
MKWYNPATWFTKSEVKLAMVAKPIDVQPVSTAIMKRHAGRLARLYWTKENRDVTDEITAEIKRRCHLLEAEGITSPKTADEAASLLKKWGG